MGIFSNNKADRKHIVAFMGVTLKLLNYKLFSVSTEDSYFFWRRSKSEHHNERGPIDVIVVR